MNIIYTICDRCGNSIPEGKGAVVLKHTDSRPYQEMHLCEKCFLEVMTPLEVTMAKAKVGEV